MAEEQVIGTARVDIVVDADGVEVATKKAKESISSMSREAQQEYSKLTAAQKRQVDGLLKNADQLGMTRSEQAAYNATLKTSGALHDEVIKRIRAHEAAQVSDNAALDMGYRSHKQLQAAMRGTPAQISDIVVSLQGGQRPMTVFLQQGLQLRDMFGSWKQVAAGAGSAVVGMINPMTLAATAVGVLFAAWQMGQKEAQAFNKAIVMSGNVAGLSAGELQTMARQVGEVTGTQREASAVLAQMAGSANIAKEGMAGYAETAINLNRLVGKSVEETVGDFESLGKSPVEASQKLNEQYGYLTFAVYEQIKALEEQGRADEAAELAQQAYKAAMDERTASLEESLGVLEKAWAGVAGVASKAWDSMLGLGREKSIEQAIAEARATIASLQSGPSATGNSEIDSFLPATGNKGAIADQKLQLNRLEYTKTVLDSLNESTAEGVRLEKERMALDSAADKYSDKATKRNKERADAIAKWGEMAKTSEEAGKQLQVVLDGIDKKYKETNTSANKAATAYAEWTSNIRQKIVAMEQEDNGTRKLTASQQFLAKLEADLATGKLKLTAEKEASVRADIAALAALENNRRATQLSVAAYKEQVKAQEEAAAESVKLSKASEELQRWTYLQNQALEESGKLLKLEASLIGASEKERKIAIATLKSQIQLEKEIEEIRTKNVKGGEEEREREREEARKRHTERLAQAETEIYVSYWNGVITSMDDAAREAFLAIGDDGVDAFQRIGRSIKTAVLDLIYQMTLKPLIVNVMGTLVTGGQGGAAAGQSGGGFNLSSLTGIPGVSAYLGSGLLSLGGMMGSMGGFATGLGATFVNGAGFMANMGAGAGLFGVGATGTGLGMMAGAALPWIGGALALMSLLDGLDGSGDPHRGAVGHYQTGFGSENYAAGVTDYDANIGRGVQGLAESIGTSFESFLASFGQSARVDVSANWADDFDGEGESWGGFVLQMQDALGEWKTLIDWSADGVGRFGQARDFGPGEEGYTEFITAVSQSYVEALKQVDLPEWASGMLDGIASDASIETIATTLNQLAVMRETLASWNTYLTEFASVGDAAFGALLESMGGFENLSSGVAAFVDLFYSDAEKLEMSQKQLQEELDKFDLKLPTLDMSNEDMDTAEEVKAAWRQMVASALDAGEEGAELAAMLLRLGPAFATTTDAAEEAAQAEAELAQAREDAHKAQIDGWMSLGGLSVQSMSQGVMDALQNGEDPGAWLADHITGGFEQAMQMQALNMVMQRIMDEALAPAMEEIMTDLFGERGDATATTAEQAVLQVFDAMDAAFASVTGETDAQPSGLLSLDTSGATGGLLTDYAGPQEAVEVWAKGLAAMSAEAINALDTGEISTALTETLSGVVDPAALGELMALLAELPTLEGDAAAEAQQAMGALFAGLSGGAMEVLAASGFVDAAFGGMSSMIIASSGDMLSAAATASVASSSAAVGHANSAINTIDGAVDFALTSINSLLSSELGQKLFGNLSVKKPVTTSQLSTPNGRHPMTNVSDRALTAATDNFASIADSLKDVIEKWRLDVLGASEKGQQNLEAEFAALTAQARLGDQAAAEKLPEIMSQLLGYTEQNSETMHEQMLAQITYMASLDETRKIIEKLSTAATKAAETAAKTPYYVSGTGLLPPSGMASFDVGTGFVPSTGVAMIHKGERIIPAVDNEVLVQSVQGMGQGWRTLEVVMQRGFEDMNALLNAIESRVEEQGETLKEIQDEGLKVVAK